MIDQAQLDVVKPLFTDAKSVIILLPPEPSDDQVMSSIALHQSLLSENKESQIGCSSLSRSFGHLRGSEVIKDSIGSQNLIITFDYPEDYLDKVDYDVSADNKFTLLIKPKVGSPAPNIDNVKYTFSGASSDLVIVFGLNSLEELGKLYADEKTFLDGAKIISLSTNIKPPTFKAHHLNSPQSTYTEIVCQICEQFGQKLTPESANLLLQSIYQNTQNLTIKAGPDTFITVAFLLRQGAQLPGSMRPAMTSPFSPPPFFEVPQLTLPQLNSQQDQSQADDSPDQAPSDWKQPKIFRATPPFPLR